MRPKIKTEGTSMARRAFLRQAGTGIAAAGLLTATACHKDVKVVPNNGLDVGAGDTGILNFAYTMEQLQAAFFTKVAANLYTPNLSGELAMYTSIRDHDILHREFLKAILKDSALPALTPDFTSINFADRTSVILAAKAIKNTCLMGYCGVSPFIHSTDYLILVGKVSSVEARHIARISDFVIPGTFTGIDYVQDGINKSNDIERTLVIINTYLSTKVSAASFNYIAE
jgi:hypothetical protein